MTIQTFQPIQNEEQTLAERAKDVQSMFQDRLNTACEAYVSAMTEYTPLTENERINMEDSASRMAKALGDMMIPKEVMQLELAHILKDAFPIENPTLPCDNNGSADDGCIDTGLKSYSLNQTPITLTEYPIHASSLCPHHFLPVQYTVFIAIKIPTRNGKGHVYGLSKYTRAVQMLSKRPVLQEQYTRDIVELFTDAVIGGSVNIGNETVAGCMVVVEGEHGCMQCRGVRTRTPTVTHYARGMDRDELQTAWELYRGYGRNH